MTLNGYFALNCFRSGLAGSDRATSKNNCVNAKINKDRPILSASQIVTGTLVSGNIMFNSWVWKIRNFQPISRRISETAQNRTKVTIND